LIYLFGQIIQRGKSTAVNQRTTDNTMVNRKRYQRGKSTAVNQRYQRGKSTASFFDLQLLIYLFVLSVVH
jgi:hypothetical protein